MYNIIISIRSFIFTLYPRYPFDVLVEMQIVGNTYQSIVCIIGVSCIPEYCYGCRD